MPNLHWKRRTLSQVNFQANHTEDAWPTGYIPNYGNRGQYDVVYQNLFPGLVPTWQKKTWAAAKMEAQLAAGRSDVPLRVGLPSYHLMFRLALLVLFVDID
jgi:hypothetical protein